MGSPLMIILKVASHNPSQMVLIQHNDMIQALAADGTDEPLDIGRLPGRPWRNHDFFDAHTLDPVAERLAVNAIAVSQKIARGRVPGECFDDLLCCPLRARMFRDVDVQDPTAVMSEDKEDEQDAERGRGHHEEVQRNQVSHVVLQECSPCRGGRFSSPDHVLLDGGFCHLDSDLCKLTDNARSAPSRVGRGHPADHVADLLRDQGTSRLAASAQSRPILSELASPPLDDGGRLNENQDALPSCPDS